MEQPGSHRAAEHTAGRTAVWDLVRPYAAVRSGLGAHQPCMGRMQSMPCKQTYGRRRTTSNALGRKSQVPFITHGRFAHGNLFIVPFRAARQSRSASYASTETAS